VSVTFSPAVMVSLQNLKADLHHSKNKTFLRRLYRINNQTAKSYKRKLINSCTKKQKQVLMSVLHFVLTAKIPFRQVHLDQVIKSKNLNFLKRHFQDKNGFKRLLSSTAKEQRDILIKVNCYHQLLYNLFRK
jgi:hypothetical protein